MSSSGASGAFRRALAPAFRRYALHVRLLWTCAPRACLGCLALTLAAAGARTAALVTTGGLIGALTRHDAGPAWWWLVGTALAFVASPIASATLAYASRVVAARYLVAVCDGIAEVGTSSYGLDEIERPETATRLDALRRIPRDWLFQAGIEQTWTLVAARLGGVGAFVVLAGWSWWAPLVLLVTWQAYARVFARWSASLWDQLLDITGNDQRRSLYLRDLLTGSRTAAEVRLFGLVDWIGDRHHRAWRAWKRAVWRRRGSHVRASIGWLMAPALATALVFVALARDAASGAVGAGLLVTLAQAVLGTKAFGPQSDAQVAMARTMVGVAGLADLRAEAGLPEVPRTLGSGAAEPVAAVGASRGTPSAYAPQPAALELSGVRFGYPGADHPTLDGLDLAIPAGQSVALVGLNGAGKTTLIRLLCGLYRPDAGTVRVDGLDPGVDPAARARIAVIFQEFVRYHLPLRDNIAAGARGSTDPAVLDRALADAGAASLLTRLPYAWDTILSAQYDHGTDLSGGQWQRVALARALASLGVGAGVLVLDEPTSALDVRAEAALFDRFLAVARGATTLLVSHRLSSVRHAERIVVLDGGRIVEDGSHERLMATGGRYARLFTLQAARFAQREVAR